jgi:hypothetical protein
VARRTAATVIVPEGATEAAAVAAAEVASSMVPATAGLADDISSNRLKMRSTFLFFIRNPYCISIITQKSQKTVLIVVVVLINLIKN